MFSIMFSVYSLVLCTTIFTQLFIMSMVNVTIELEGELELRGNMAVLEMNLELPKSFYVICKLRA